MKLGKVVKFITSLASIALLIIALPLVLSYFSISGFRSFVVLSGSMEPAIPVGSVIFTKSFSEYKVGDVITFRPNGSNSLPITHRIHEIETENGNVAYVTKGDANNATDFERVQKENILGRSLFHIPYLGHIISFAKKPAGFLLIVLLPALAVIYDELLTITKTIQSRRGPKMAEPLKSDEDAKIS